MNGAYDLCPYSNYGVLLHIKSLGWHRCPACGRTFRATRVMWSTATRAKRKLPKGGVGALGNIPLAKKVPKAER